MKPEEGSLQGNLSQMMYQVLVIEDEPINQLILKEVLEHQGYRVSLAQDGEDGIAQAEKLRPGLIICDWMMPKMNGLEVCRWVKSHPQLSSAFFILLTARSELEDRIKGLDTGADDFLAKPIDPSELQARVRAGFRLYQSAQDLRQLTLDLKTQQQRLEAELAEAADYVRSLLPGPIEGDLKIDSRFLPSRQLGGDCFDYYWLDNDHLVVYLLDMSGHGLGSALPSVSMQNLLRSHSLPNADPYHPETVLAALNQCFEMNHKNPRFFTIWYGVYHQSERRLTYACAGHPPAIWIPDNAEVGGQVKQFGQLGQIPIGMFPDVDYASDDCVIDQPGSLYVFSDGLYELEQRNGTLWDLEGLTMLLINSANSASTNLDEIIQGVQAIQGQDAFEDDCSLIQIRFS